MIETGREKKEKFKNLLGKGAKETNLQEKKSLPPSEFAG